MKKKTIKPTKSTPEYDSQRETRVLLEEMNHGIKTIGEQHGTIVKRLDNIESELNSVKMAVMDNSLETKALKTGQQEIKQKLDTVIADHEQRLQKLEAIK